MEKINVRNEVTAKVFVLLIAMICMSLSIEMSANNLVNQPRWGLTTTTTEIPKSGGYVYVTVWSIDYQMVMVDNFFFDVLFLYNNIPVNATLHDPTSFVDTKIFKIWIPANTTGSDRLTTISGIYGTDTQYCTTDVIQRGS